MTAPPITATCRWCDERIEWCDIYGWVLPGKHPSPATWDCSVREFRHTGSHAPKEATG